mmetsp:Transcript_16884/g.25432  ORF Transcript_16884/g.25432 Transcript_16884/m.25432 type:complete len:201 (-) Transcript_16884:1058-1660(-)
MSLVMSAGGSHSCSDASVAFRPAILQCENGSFMAFVYAWAKTRFLTDSFSFGMMRLIKMVAFVRMEFSGSFCRPDIQRTSLSCSCCSSSLSTIWTRLLRVSSLSLALESANPPMSGSNILLFTDSRGNRCTSDLRDLNKAVLIVLSLSIHSCCKGTRQVFKNGASSTLFAPAHPASRSKDDCTVCLQVSLASLFWNSPAA